MSAFLHPKSILFVGLASTLALQGAALAQPPVHIEEMVIIGARDTHIVRTDDTMVAAPDTGTLLRKMPGANVNKNGELTSVAQYRGMYGDRVNVSINGAHISSGGPNAMDAPLHYAPVAVLESLSISRGIAPVSAGQETLGGNIDAVTYQGEFGNSSNFEWGGRAYAGAQSVNSGMVGSVFLSLSNRNHLMRGFVMKELGDDSRFNGGKLLPSEYDRDRFDLGYSFRTGDHEFSVDVARNDTGNSGTPALPMDIMVVESDLARAKYAYDGARWNVSAELSMNDIGHWMSNFHLRTPPQDSASGPGTNRYRNTYTASDNTGFVLKAERTVNNGYWRFGADGHYSKHIALIQNPNKRYFFIDNFNDAEKNITGFYIERNLLLSEITGLDLGVRHNHVKMSSAEVAVNMNPDNLGAGGPVMMNNVAQQLANQFNAMNRSQTDNNTDWFARISVDPGYGIIWYAGAASKTRSPSYQERYLWLPAESTGGLADGKTYIGNPNLKPEVAQEYELGFDLSMGALSLYPRIFYKDVSDFIHGVTATNPLAISFAQMQANMGMGTANPLQFSNVDARYRGFDMDANYEISSRLALRGVVSIVRAERKDIADDLYRISPDNLILALDYRGNGWSGSLESVTYARQDRVSDTNLEQETAGYTLVNLSTSIHPGNRQDLEIGLGVNNLFDRHHYDHLGGYNRAVNPDIALRERLPGLGRNVYGRVMWYF